MDFTQIRNTADVIQDVLNIGGCQPEFAPKTLRCILIFEDQWNRDADLKLLATQQHEKTIGCATARSEGGYKYIGVDDYSSFHVGIIYDTISLVKTCPFRLALSYRVSVRPTRIRRFVRQHKITGKSLLNARG